MVLKEREAESVSLNGVVSQIVPGEKYTRLEADDDEIVQEIEMELFSQADIKQNRKDKKQDKKYHKITEIEEIVPDEEISLDDDQEEKKLTQQENETEGVVEEESKKGIMEKLKKFHERNALKIAWGCTICGLLCTGWIGPCFRLLGSEGVAPARRAAWRSQALLILLLIPTLFEYRTLTAQQKRDLFSKHTLLQLLLCGTLWFFDLFLWSNALDFTTVSRSSVFGSTASLMILVWSLIRRQQISGLEITGGVVGFSGLVFAVVGTNFFSAGASEQNATRSLWKGDILSIASAMCVAAYVLNATKVRAKVSVFIYTISNTLLLFIALSSASFIMEGTKFDISTEGLFGWLSPQYLIIIGLLSVVAGLIGFNLNNAALRYMPPLGYTLVTLCDPIISGTYAWIIKADGVPGIFTFIGGSITIGGIVVVVLGQERRKQKEKLAIAEREAKETEQEEIEIEMEEESNTIGDKEEKRGEKEEERGKDEKSAKKVVEFVVSDGSEV